jgi:hypothetical protein
MACAARVPPGPGEAREGFAQLEVAVPSQLDNPLVRAREEKVVDVPPKLSARARVFATGQGRKTDATDAHSIALVGTRMAGKPGQAPRPCLWPSRSPPSGRWRTRSSAEYSPPKIDNSTGCWPITARKSNAEKAPPIGLCRRTQVAAFREFGWFARRVRLLGRERGLIRRVGGCGRVA